MTADDALFAIRNGGFSGELMPRNIVTGEDAKAVARFVARYSGSKAAEIHTPCGTQSASTGPFYCPAAHGVYVNTDFFDALSRA